LERCGVLNAGIPASCVFRVDPQNQRTCVHRMQGYRSLTLRAAVDPREDNEGCQISATDNIHSHIRPFVRLFFFTFLPHGCGHPEVIDK
jgi:hypothetical protein